MENILSWENCLNKHIRRVQVDTSKAKSAHKLFQIRKEELKNKKAAFMKLEDYYEIIKELTSALMILDGLKSSNHECIVSYFAHRYPDHKYEAEKLHELKNIRNNIQYEASIPEDEYLTKNELEFIHIVDMLEHELLKELSIS